MNEHKVDSLGMYFGIFAALMALTWVTVGAAYIDFGKFSVAVALFIAAVKGILVIWFFMHVQHGSGLLKIFVMSGFLCFFLLVVITLTDYTTRPNAELTPNTSWISRTASHFEERSKPEGFERHASKADSSSSNIHH